MQKVHHPQSFGQFLYPDVTLDMEGLLCQVYSNVFETRHTTRELGDPAKCSRQEHAREGRHPMNGALVMLPVK